MPPGRDWCDDASGRRRRNRGTVGRHTATYKATTEGRMAEKLVIIGSGPGGVDLRDLRRPGQPGPARLRGRDHRGEPPARHAAAGAAQPDHRSRKLPRLPRGHPGPGADDARCASRPSAFGTRIVTEDIAHVDLSRRPFALNDSAGETIEAHALVIATGASANYLGLESEEQYKNHGVSACAVCDGALPRFRNKPLIVVGGGDSACEEGNYLTKFASTVYLVHRRDTLPGQPDHGRADC